MPKRIELYVAPGGDDRSSGTREQPFATVARARRAVRLLRRQGETGGVSVLLRGGTYRFTKPLVFGLADGAPAGATTTYAAAAREHPVLSAGIAVDGWVLPRRLPAGFPARARGRVWRACLPEAVACCRVLYAGDTRLRRARGPGFVPLPALPGQDKHTLRFRGKDLRSWPGLRNAELVLITAWPWTMNILPLAAVDESGHRARVGIAGTYELARPRFGHFSASAWVENLPQFVDRPGTWYLDQRRRMLYLWPSRAGEPGDILAPATTEIIRVEGGIRYDRPADKPVEGLVFRGLTFSHGDRYQWERDHVGRGVQHDWEMFDRSTALLRLRGAERCRVEKCRFKNAGGTGVRMDLHCQANRVTDCEFSHLGGVGIFLCGYGPGTKDVNRDNRILRNHVHDIGGFYWHSPGIFVWQSGHNLIRNNLLHSLPYSAIVVSGRIIWDREGRGEASRTVRWHEVEAASPMAVKIQDWWLRERFLHARDNRVEYNEITDVMRVMGDGNGIYVSGAGAGNRVACNYIHDCLSPHFAEAIRCDDDQHETVIHGNVILRIGGVATFVTIKGINHVTNNIFAFPVVAPMRGMLALERSPVAGSRVQGNVFLVDRKQVRIVYQGLTYYGTTTALSQCVVGHNLYWNMADPKWGSRHLAREQVGDCEVGSIAAPPGFTDPGRGDFSLRPGADVLKTGFVPIDLSRVGLPGKDAPGADNHRRDAAKGVGGSRARRRGSARG